MTKLYLLSLLSLTCFAGGSKKPAEIPAAEAPEATSSSPQYIIKDVQISFEDGDEPVPELHPVETKKKAAAKKKTAKAQGAAAAKGGKASSTSKAPAEKPAPVK